MRIEARVFQAALKSYGVDPGPLDGIIGPLTVAAAADFDADIGTYDDYSIIPATDNRSVEIVPETVARRFKNRGDSYLLEHPEEIVFRDRAPVATTVTRRAPTETAPGGASPTTTAIRRATTSVVQGTTRAVIGWIALVLGVLGVGLGAFFISRGWSGLRKGRRARRRSFGSRTTMRRR